MAELPFSLYTVKHYADIVNKSPRTIRRWIKEERVKARKDRGGKDWLIEVKNKSDFLKKETPVS